jgi:alpha-galactosidase
LRFVGQKKEEQEESIIITTTCENREAGLEAVHYLRWNQNEPYLTSWSKVFNSGTEAVSLELLTSFNLGHITPFHRADAPERLFVHRFRSAWSSEGRHEVRRVEELELERSWIGHGMRCERFGMTGTKPTRRWFPFVAVEDKEEKVFWGAQLAWAGSWQLELFRQDDFLAISGGLADREFGHWVKQIEPGEHFTSPVALLTTVAGEVGERSSGSHTQETFDELCARLTGAQSTAAEDQPESEDSLPILFNEWCTSWGRPNHQQLINLADTCREFGIPYLVIDAGWYASDERKWEEYQGDWQSSPKLFPEGIAATCREIRERGIIPGLWFEFEVVGPKSSIWDREDLLLMRDGKPIQAGTRRFLDFRKEEVHSYLEKRVLDLIEQCVLGYIKVDYNETVGIGCDGAESLGEGLREHVEGVYRFFRRIRKRFPDLLIENCSAGGQRLEPSMTMLTAMSSFSDAHETSAIPIIAANIQRLIPTRQSQIWAVLRHSDSEKRLYYSLAATMLGRMCLSGDLTELSDSQREIVQRAMDFYRYSSEIIKHGTSYRYGPTLSSYLHPKGWQAIVRYAGSAADRILLVVHRFEEEETPIRVPLSMDLPGDLSENRGYRIANLFTDRHTNVTCQKEAVDIRGLRSFSGCAAVLEQQ